MKQRKKILLTGATSGIGKAAAFRLAEQGHHVIVHGRNTDKAERTRQEILASVPGAEVDMLIADLSRKADVLSMVEIFNSRYDGLDVLINNAGGVMNKQREETVDGWEINHSGQCTGSLYAFSIAVPTTATAAGCPYHQYDIHSHKRADADIDDLMSDGNIVPCKPTQMRSFMSFCWDRSLRGGNSYDQVVL